MQSSLRLPRCLDLCCTGSAAAGQRRTLPCAPFDLAESLNQRLAARCAPCCTPPCPFLPPQTSLTENGFILARLTRAKLLHGLLCRLVGLAGHPPPPDAEEAPGAAEAGEASEAAGEGGGGGADDRYLISYSRLWNSMTLEEALQVCIGRAAGLYLLWESLAFVKVQRAQQAACIAVELACQPDPTGAQA